MGKFKTWCKLLLQIKFACKHSYKEAIAIGGVIRRFLPTSFVFQRSLKPAVLPNANIVSRQGVLSTMTSVFVTDDLGSRS